MNLQERESARAIALSRLDAVIGKELEAGQRIPCVSADWELWTSEHSDDLREAADACQWCPALDACRRYVDQYPEKSGAWAGTVPSERTRK